MIGLNRPLLTERSGASKQARSTYSTPYDSKYAAALQASVDILIFILNHYKPAPQLDPRTMENLELHVA